MGIQLVVNGRLARERNWLADAIAGASWSDEGTLIAAHLVDGALRLELRRPGGDVAIVHLALRVGSDDDSVAPAYVAFLLDLFAPLGQERCVDMAGPRRAAVERETLRWMAALGQQVLLVAENIAPDARVHPGTALPIVYRHDPSGVDWTAVVTVEPPAGLEVSPWWNPRQAARWLRGLARCERWMSTGDVVATRRAAARLRRAGELEESVAPVAPVAASVRTLRLAS